MRDRTTEADVPDTIVPAALMVLLIGLFAVLKSVRTAKRTDTEHDEPGRWSN